MNGLLLQKFWLSLDYINELFLHEMMLLVPLFHSRINPLFERISNYAMDDINQVILRQQIHVFLIRQIFHYLHIGRAIRNKILNCKAFILWYKQSLYIVLIQNLKIIMNKSLDLMIFIIIMKKYLVFVKKTKIAK